MMMLISLPKVVVVVVFVTCCCCLPLALAQNNNNNDCGISRRRPWRSLSCREKEEFLVGVTAMKESGLYDDITRVHASTGDLAHRTDAFFPWHRWYLTIFERELQRITSSCITVPYWNWERDDEDDDSYVETVFTANAFGTRRRGCVVNGIVADWETHASGGCVQREFNPSVDLAREVELLSRITNADNFEEIWIATEGSPHAAVHNHIGGSMLDDFSPDDPIFWLHHSNIDRVWAIWQNYRGHSQLSEQDYTAEHYSANLDKPLQYVNDRRGLFGQPTPREILSNSGNLVHVQYLEDNLALALARTDTRFLVDESWNVPGRSSGFDCTPGDVVEVPQDNNNDDEGGDDDDDEQGNDDSNCREASQRCQVDQQCCSNICAASSFCEERESDVGRGGSAWAPTWAPTWEPTFRRIRKHRDLKSVGKDDEPEATTKDTGEDIFGNRDMDSRLYELVNMDNVTDPAQLFDILAREDCDNRTLTKHHTLQSANPKWTQKWTMSTNKTIHVFDCHYEIVHHNRRQ